MYIKPPFDLLMES